MPHALGTGRPRRTAGRARADLTYPRAVTSPSPPRSGSSLVPKIVVGAVVAFVALTVLGWVVGTIISVLRFLAVVVVVVAVIWALLAMRSDAG